MIKVLLKKKPFKKVCLGGTFDHFHDGHKELLKIAFKMGIHVSIGLTTNSLLNNKKFYSQIQTYEERKKNLKRFIEEGLNKASDLYTIVPLSDPLGQAVKDPELKSLICSHETYKSCVKINEIRIKSGLDPIVIIIIPLILNPLGKKLSSTDIRAKLTHIEVNY